MPRSNKPELDILSVPWRAAGVACIIFAGGLVTWASLTKIPRKVNGQGVYYSIGDTSSFITRDYGKVHVFINTNAESSQSVAKINNMLGSVRVSLEANTDIDGVIETAENLILELNRIESNQYKNSASLTSTINQLPLPIKENTLVVYAESSEKKSALIQAIGSKNALKNQLIQQENRNRLLQETLKADLTQRSEFQKDLRKLAAIKFISKLAELENKTAINSLKSEINSLNTEVREIKTALNKAETEVRTRFYDFVTSTMLFENNKIYIQQVSTPKTDYMEPGRLVLSYSKNEIKHPDLVPVFFSVKDVTTLKNNDRALVSLPGFPKSVYGGINAEVVKRQNLSVMSKQTESFLGLSGFSEFLEYNFISPTMVTIALKKDNNGDLKWTTTRPSNKQPKIQLGDKINVEVVVGTITPIEMIIPSIKNILGMTPPEIKEAKPKADQQS